MPLASPVEILYALHQLPSAPSRHSGQLRLGIILAPSSDWFIQGGFTKQIDRLWKATVRVVMPSRAPTPSWTARAASCRSPTVPALLRYSDPRESISARVRQNPPAKVAGKPADSWDHAWPCRAGSKGNHCNSTIPSPPGHRAWTRNLPRISPGPSGNLTDFDSEPANQVSYPTISMLYLFGP
jgi:hypothetical protein